MIRFIEGIDGPTFLWIYGAIAAAGICLLFWWKSKHDDSLNYKMPDPEGFDSTYMAVFRGGWLAAIRTMMFDLWQKEVILINGDKKLSLRKNAREKMKEIPESNILEHTVYKHIASGTDYPKEITKKVKKDLDGGTLENWRKSVEEKLETLHLRHSDNNAFSIKVMYRLFQLPWLALGITKVVLGIMKSRPVVFLIIEIVLAWILLAVIISPSQRMTQLGKQFQKRLEQKFEWLKKSLSNKSPGTFVEPSLAMMGIAIFGVSALGTNPLYQDFKNNFNATYDSSGGCGSTGGCGGGGCGGGGCGGGGCGGCGGCGG